MRSGKHLCNLYSGDRLIFKARTLYPLYNKGFRYKLPSVARTLYLSLIIPAQNANPNHKRLDGRTSGGNRNIFDCFQHYGRTWKMHSDTHCEPLMLAYNLAINDGDPFIENTTKGGNTLLVLQPEVKNRQSSGCKHLYIYEI